MISNVNIWLVIFVELEKFVYPIYRLVSYLTFKLTGSEYDSYNWLRNQIGQLINLRLEQKIERKDYMQLLLNVMKDEVSTIHDAKHLDEISGEHLVKQLGREEVEANLLVFMLAGYETTSTFLSYSTYILVFHQDIQQKLFEEMAEAFGSGSKVIVNSLCENLDIIYKQFILIIISFDR